MPTISVVTENGIEEQEVFSRDAIVIPEDSDFDSLEPAVVRSIEYDHKGQQSSITTTCGETENRRESDDKPDITLQGILTYDQLETAKNLKEGDEITLSSDVHQGQVFVHRLTITQTSDLNYFVPDGSNEEQLAFEFQLQLSQPE